MYVAAVPASVLFVKLLPPTTRKRTCEPRRVAFVEVQAMDKELTLRCATVKLPGSLHEVYTNSCAPRSGDTAERVVPK